MSQLPSKYQENQRAPNMDNNPRHGKRYLIRSPFASQQYLDTALGLLST